MRIKAAKILCTEILQTENAVEKRFLLFSKQQHINKCINKLESITGIWETDISASLED